MPASGEHENTSTCGASCPQGTRIALLEREVAEMKTLLWGQPGRPGVFEEIKDTLDDLKKQMGQIKLVIVFLAGLAGAGGTTLVGTLLGVQIPPHVDKAQVQQVATIQEK